MLAESRPLILAAAAASLLLLPLHDASASHGAPISGRGTATVDGRLSAGEWAGAATIDFTAALPAAEGGGSVPARALVMNDGANLYLALRLSRSTYGSGAEFGVFFDRANNGFRQNGDDALLVQVWRTSGLSFYDGYRWVCPGAPAGAEAHCGGGHDWIQVQGAPPGGTTDGLAAVHEGEGEVTFELAHPLDSADDAHDFSLAPGSLVGYSMFAQFNASCHPNPGCWAGGAPPPGHIGISPGADLQLAARATPARARLGSNLTYTLTARAAASGAQAADVVLEAELPAGVRVTAVRSSTGRCEGRPLLTCRLGSLAPGSAAVVTIRGRAVRAGAARLRARVASKSYETGASRRTATATASIVRPRRR